jgi:hypothetical protein
MSVPSVSWLSEIPFKWRNVDIGFAKHVSTK